MIFAIIIVGLVIFHYVKVQLMAPTGWWCNKNIVLLVRRRAQSNFPQYVKGIH